MRLSILPLGVVLACAGFPVLADVPALDLSAPGSLSAFDKPDGAQTPPISPAIAAPLEKSLEQELPNGDNVSLYAGYPGTAAIGPDVDSPLIAALDGLEATTGQGWVDQAFEAFGVVTAGLAHDDWQFETSRFTGRNDFRSPYEIAKLDSTALRLTWNYDSNLSFQGSWGSLKSPELYAPGIDEDRWTASAKYTFPFGRGGSWSAMFAWGLKQQSIGADLHAVAFDTECKPVNGWTFFAHGGFEQNNALALDGQLDPGTMTQSGTVSFGAVHDWTLFERVKIGAGGLYAFDLLPQLPGTTPVQNTGGAVAYVHLTVQ